MKRRGHRKGRARFERACGKVRYPDADSAKIALSSVQKRFAQGDFKGGDAEAAYCPVKWYWHEACSGYHLSSQGT